VTLDFRGGGGPAWKSLGKFRTVKRLGKIGKRRGEMGENSENQWAAVSGGRRVFVKLKRGDLGGEKKGWSTRPTQEKKDCYRVGAAGLTWVV